MIRVGFAGTLSYYNPSDNSPKSLFQRFLGTYRHHFNLSYTRSPYYLFQAISELNNEIKDLDKQLQFNFWGNIDKKNKALLSSLKINHLVTIEGNFSKQESIQKLKECDVLFLPLESGNNEHKTLFIPGKVFEYIQLKKPILALGEDSDCVEILKNTGLALIANNKDVKDIKQKLSELITKDLKTITNEINEKYISSLAFKNRAEEFAQIFDDLI